MTPVLRTNPVRVEEPQKIPEATIIIGIIVIIISGVIVIIISGVIVIIISGVIVIVIIITMGIMVIRIIAVPGSHGCAGTSAGRHRTRRPARIAVAQDILLFLALEPMCVRIETYELSFQKKVVP